MIHKYIAVPILTQGNTLFPDIIEIDDVKKIVNFKKRSNILISYRNTSVLINQITEVTIVHRAEKVFFSRIEIETLGGGRLLASGFIAEKAIEIKELIESLR